MESLVNEKYERNYQDEKGIENERNKGAEIFIQFLPIPATRLKGSVKPGIC